MYEREKNSFEMDGVEMVNSHASVNKMNIVKFAMLLVVMAIAFSSHVFASSIISGQPESITVTTNSSATFSVETTESDAEYTWFYQMPTDKFTWTRVPSNIATGVNTNTLTITNVVADYHSYAFRCVVNGSVEEVSNIAYLYVDENQVISYVYSEPPTIVTHPETITVNENDEAKFTVETSEGTYTYEWLYKKPTDEFTWSAVPSEMGTGINTNTLTITKVISEYQGYAFKCIVTGEKSEVSNVAYLYVINESQSGDVCYNPNIITTQPETITVNENDEAKFTVETVEGTYTYEWLYKKPTDEFTWSEIPSEMGTGIYTNTLTITKVISEYQGYAFKCIVKGEYSEVSNVAYLYVINESQSEDVFYNPNIIITQPETITVNENDEATFTVEAMITGSCTYEWLYKKSTDEFTWSEIPSEMGTGIYTDTLTIQNVTSEYQGYAFKCIVTGIKSEVSNVAYLYVINQSQSGDVYLRDKGFVILSETEGTAEYGTTEVSFTVTNSHSEDLIIEEITNTNVEIKLEENLVTISNISNLDVGTIVKIKVSCEETTEYTSASAEYTLTIVRSNMLPVISIGDYTYGGTVSTPSISGNIGNGTVTYYYNTINSNSNGTQWAKLTPTTLNVGTYYIYAVISATSNYNEVTTDTVAFNVKPIIVEIPTGKTLTYNKEEQIGVEAGEGYTVTGNIETNVGKYEATVKLESTNYIWSDGTSEDKKVSFEIKAKSSEGLTINLSETEFIYDGTEKIPTVTIKDGEDVVPESNYDVVITDNVNPGEATVTVTFKENYEGTKEVTFTIITTITTDAPTLELNTETNEVTITVNQETNYKNEDATITYEYRVSGDTEFIKADSNILDNLEAETTYEIRTILKDVTGNEAVSEIATITTVKLKIELLFEVVTPESGTYSQGTVIEILAKFDSDITMTTIPVLGIKFGNGSVIELTGTFNEETDTITYTYTIQTADDGELTEVSYVGTVNYGQIRVIEYNMVPEFTGSKIIAKTVAKLSEEGKEDRYFASVQDAIDAATTNATVTLIKSEELNETIIVDNVKNIKLNLNGKDLIIESENAIVIINKGTLEIFDEIGSSEIIASGTNTVKTIDNQGTLNVTSGTIRAELNDKTEGAVAIYNQGLLTIGVDDGDVETAVPFITSTEYGIQNIGTEAVKFNDGTIEGARDKSYEGSLEVPAGYDIITERIENNRERTSIGVDKVPPTLTYTILTTGWQKEYVEVEIVATDAESGIRFVTLNNKEIELIDSKTTVKLTENKEFIVYAEDNASNSSSESIEINTIDKVAPRFDDIISEEDVIAGTLEVLIEVQDIESGLAGIMVSEEKTIPEVDDENWTAIEGYPTSKQSISMTLDRDKTYYCFAKDRVGNIARYIGTIKAGTIDKEPPVIESLRIVKDDGKDFVSGKAVIVEVGATDNIGVSEILISNTDLTDDSVRASSDWKVYNKSMIYELPVEGDKTYTIYVWVKDYDGNISARALTSAKLKALVVGDNEFDYTGSDTIYNKTILRFLAKDYHFDFTEEFDDGKIILRLTKNNAVLRNITNGLSLEKIRNYDGLREGDLAYLGEVYELTMENLNGTGNLNIVILDKAITDEARNPIDAQVIPTDIFVDNNPPKLTVTNTATYNEDGVEYRNIEVVDSEGYRIDFVEVSYSGIIETHRLTDGKTRIAISNGAIVTAYDKAGNETMFEVTNTEKPTLTVSSEKVQLTYGGNPENITYEYNGDGVIEILSSDTKVANVSINTDTKEITVSPENAGNSEITLRVLKSDNYIESEIVINVEVLPLKVNLSWDEEEFDYDGERKFVNAKVTNKILDDDVIVSKYMENNRINAGEYTAEAIEVSDNNYTVEGGTGITHNWKINKINRTLTLDKTSFDMEMPLDKTITYEYTGEDTTATVKVSNGSIINAVINNKDCSGEVTVTPITIGKSSVTVTVPESTNYFEVSKTCEIEVVKKIRIFFDSQGGTEHDSKIVVYNREYGELPVPERIGYTFLGWYTESAGGSKIESTTIVTATDIHTLYAHWTPIIYNITYELNGGTVSGNPTTYTIETPTITLNNPLKIGYTFTGWTGSNGDAPQTTVRIPLGSYGDKNYTANYRENVYTVDLSSTSGKVTYGSTNSFTITSEIPGKIEVTSSSSNVGITAGNGATLVANTASTITYSGVTATTSATTITIKFTPTDAITYLGKEITYTVTSVDRAPIAIPGGKTLTYNRAEQQGVDAGTGYTLGGTYKATNVGSYTATATLDSNYMWNDGTTGAKNIGWLINAKAANTLTVTLGQTTYTYDGNEKKPTVTVKDGSATLTEGTDYTVTYSNNINAGTATVTITGKGNYTGTTSKTFTINPKSISSATVTLSQTNYTYDGTAKKPTPTVKDGSKTLTKGTDYTVSYSNNTYAGTATVKITGKGNYKDTVSKTFTITAYYCSCSACNAVVSSNGARCGSCSSSNCSTCGRCYYCCDGHSTPTPTPTPTSSSGGSTGGGGTTTPTTYECACSDRIYLDCVTTTVERRIV